MEVVTILQLLEHVAGHDSDPIGIAALGQEGPSGGIDRDPLDDRRPQLGAGVDPGSGVYPRTPSDIEEPPSGNIGDSAYKRWGEQGPTSVHRRCDPEGEAGVIELTDPVAAVLGTGPGHRSARPQHLQELTAPWPFP